jgi:hypothetical protein
VEVPQLPDAPVMGVTTRQEVVAHSRDPMCGACHSLLDPPGFALENFDQVGRRRETENGKPVDSSGTLMNGGDLEGPFAQGDDLLSRMSTSATVRGCFAQQYFQFAVSGDVAGRVAPADQCSLERVTHGFSGPGDLRGLVQLIATSDSFRFRLSEGAPL